MNGENTSQDLIFFVVWQPSGISPLFHVKLQDYKSVGLCWLGVEPVKICIDQCSLASSVQWSKSEYKDFAEVELLELATQMQA